MIEFSFFFCLAGEYAPLSLSMSCRRLAEYPQKFFCFIIFFFSSWCGRRRVHSLRVRRVSEAYDFMFTANVSRMREHRV